MNRLASGFAPGQREELEQAGVRVDTLDELFPATTDVGIVWQLIPTIDVMYVHQLQPAHVSRMMVKETISLLKPEAMVLNPELQNETAAQLLNDSPHNGYFAHLRGSVFMRMAVFQAIMG